jgi:hypothetical protein
VSGRPALVFVAHHDPAPALVLVRRGDAPGAVGSPTFALRLRPGTVTVRLAARP